jgi:hypothetical protein
MPSRRCNWPALCRWSCCHPSACTRGTLTGTSAPSNEFPSRSGCDPKICATCHETNTTLELQKHPSFVPRHQHVSNYPRSRTAEHWPSATHVSQSAWQCTCVAPFYPLFNFFLPGIHKLHLINWLVILSTFPDGFITNMNTTIFLNLDLHWLISLIDIGPINNPRQCRWS